MDETNASPRPAGAPPRGAGLPRRIYLPRTVGLGFGALCAGAGLYEANAPAWVWAVMLTYCFVWPHLAVHLALRATSPFTAENRNLLIDSLAGGFWAVGMAFNLLPSILILTTLAMNNFAAGGVRLFRKGLVAHAAGACLGLLTVGFQFQPASSFQTVLLSIPFLLSYPLVLGVVMYRLSIELARRKDALQQEKQRAEQANLAKSRFLAAASHDLRQPLHALSLFSATLIELGLNRRQHEVADQMRRSIESLKDMFDDLLDISKLDAGHISTALGHFRVQPLLDTLEIRFGAMARRKGLVLKVRRSTAVLHSDMHLLQRVLDNLLANAIRYTDAGGILVGCRRRGALLRIEVWDTGRGIAAAQKDRIFEEFVQVDPLDEARSYRGLGLGLAIARRMAGLLDTRIEVRSVPQRGSVFSITVPMGDPASVVLDAPDMIESTDVLAGKRILVVDDEPSIREGMRQLMSGWHCQVVVADSGPDALAMLDQVERTPDLIIADYHTQAPGDGLHIVQQVRERVGRHVPALIITGETAPEQLAELRRSGVNTLHKPLRVTQLRAHCTALLRKG